MHWNTNQEMSTSLFTKFTYEKSSKETQSTLIITFIIVIGGGAITSRCLLIPHLASFHAQWNHLIYLLRLLHFVSLYSFISAAFTIHHPFLWTSLFTSELCTRIQEMENTHWKHKPFKYSTLPHQKCHCITVFTLFRQQQMERDTHCWSRLKCSSWRPTSYSTQTPVSQTDPNSKSQQTHA